MHMEGVQMNDSKNRQTANRENGIPCYCASLTGTLCDMCSGISPEGSDRWNLQLEYQRSLTVSNPAVVTFTWGRIGGTR